MHSKDIKVSDYIELFNLPRDANISLIQHENAIVATVYAITLPNNLKMVLKVCENTKHYQREKYFLKALQNKIPLPTIINSVESSNSNYPAILMHLLDGELLRHDKISKNIAYQAGKILANIHTNKTDGFGDIANQNILDKTPKNSFLAKFTEELDECREHLPNRLINKIEYYVKNRIHLLDNIDTACFIHKDFSPRNIIIKDDQIQGIIDWSSAKAGFALEDFCTIEHFGEGWEDFHGYKDYFLKGYTEITQLPEHRGLIPLLRLSRSIAVVGFTVKQGTWNNRDSSFYNNNRSYIEELFD